MLLLPSAARRVKKRREISSSTHRSLSTERKKFKSLNRCAFMCVEQSFFRAGSLNLTCAPVSMRTELCCWSSALLFIPSLSRLFTCVHTNVPSFPFFTTRCSITCETRATQSSGRVWWRFPMDYMECVYTNPKII